MERTFKCYVTEDPRAAEVKEKLNGLEAALAQVGVQRTTQRAGSRGTRDTHDAICHEPPGACMHAHGGTCGALHM